jgi:hypothetical protein
MSRSQRISADASGSLPEIIELRGRPTYDLGDRCSKRLTPCYLTDGGAGSRAAAVAMVPMRPISVLT